MIAGLAIGSKMGFIYLRGEYRYLLEIMEQGRRRRVRAAAFSARTSSATGFDFDIITHTGAGAYEVGEESALMESLEGKRGVPRIKPPFPAVVGLYGGPTVINNAETIASVPAHHRDGRRGVREDRHRAQRRHAPLRHQRPRRTPRRLRAAHGLQPQEDDLRGRAAASPTARSSRPSSPAAHPAPCSAPTRSMSAWTSTRWARPAPCSAPAASSCSTKPSRSSNSRCAP